MSCQKNNITGDSWAVLKNLPAFRYFKEPVDTVAQLYEKYPDGVERGALAYVSELNWFYTFRITDRTWVPVGINDLVVNEIISDVIQNEIEAREGADSSLHQLIENEIEAREGADAAILEAIENGDGGGEDLQKHIDNKKVHIQDLGNNPNLNDITNVGYYFYTLMANGSPVKQNGYLHVVGSEQTGIIQLRYSVYGIDMRRQKGYDWDEWTHIGGVPEAPQDGKLYARKDGEWVEANDKRIVILSEEEYEGLSGGYDEDTLYFII